MKDNRFDVEGELRKNRSQPRADFTSALAGEVREASGRAKQSRVGMMLALAGLVTVAVASFGGVGYASSNQPANSAAGAQYKVFTPPKAKPKVKPKKHIIKAAPKAQVQAATKTAAAPKATSQLPFTGLTLWVPLAAGLVLIALGLVLRTRGRRGRPTAH